MKGIIDVLWEEVLATWDREHSGLPEEEFHEERQKYQIGLIKRAIEEREK